MNIYLASPYSHESEIVMEGRYYAALDATAFLIKAGYNVFSPIVHSHHIGRLLGNSVDSAFWTGIDLSFIDRWADVLVVLCIPGWWKSAGIMREVDRAASIGIPMSFCPVESCKFEVSERNRCVMVKAMCGYMWE